LTPATSNSKSQQSDHCILSHHQAEGTPFDFTFPAHQRLLVLRQQGKPSAHAEWACNLNSSQQQYLDKIHKPSPITIYSTIGREVLGQNYTQGTVIVK
jgi:hypothetical protein